MAGDTVSRDGLELLAACVAANVDHTARTTALIEDNLRAERNGFAKALADVIDRLAAIPAMQRTVYIDRIIGDYSYRVDHAQQCGYLDDTTDSY